MADSTLAALTASTPGTAGLLYTVQGGANRKLSMTAAGASMLEAANAAAQQVLLGITGGGNISLGGYTLTVPATGTAALLGANTFTAAQTVSGGTVTVSTPLLDLSQTWNAGAVAFTGIKANYTATAAAATSMLMDLQVGGTSKFKVVANSATANTQVIFSGNGASTTITQAASEVSFNNGFSATLRFGLGNIDTSIVGQGCPIQLGNYGDNPFKFSKNVNSSAVTFVVAVDAADVFALRNATAAQTLRVYGTYTDASNYVRLALNTTSTTMGIACETAGTGADNIDLSLTPAGTGLVCFGAHSAVGAETVTGFITIKDSGGTSRKIAVIS